MNLCRRCYIEKNKLKKKDIKQIISTVDKYKCDGCGEYKTIVIEKKSNEEMYNDDEY